MIFRHGFSSSANEISVEISDTGVREIGQVAIKQDLLIHVTGAVNQEGVYKVKSGDRIVDVLRLAGGATPLANLSSINLAEKVKDGQRIVVPEKTPTVSSVSVQRINISPAGKQGSKQASSSKTEKTGVFSGKVNVNSADVKALCQVKGIGESMAKRIVEYREKSGPFAKLEDLTKVKGIGKGKLGKIREQIGL
ncbi:hypothetical protein A2291_06210 [candidate division WOR-1 bacterium RIFOXYB2_FULL_42_35]|uniref:Helix-hairpin-helix DNA-binding motif class 1 domain-containing protein n=1 Tax=candidate division WOR-1 bacterium RIFOXYC2_FULL_41_25 TaxID=1802586 RepID=A0A1F4TIR9_UNCSA|nr:MAG: hypothetical protein A2247_07860 [candidate division WOR-1 bacterium RIFOXYA2_FULL_41_14]OGC21615.1 MAG: hypothetical protein A2291_06210 [candidate division WOR-1 bacterium RIFOXYB2_FULL_42_35]OGC32618.1 MAG: hypothetical protein A2462_01970 [candidate division WOR-1 bacterium RIFOXYC2_FULL_41_25]OGC41493.1 MAG: hypothetical protein A2548_04250 [candidate division WOR-1 bacterium RIFOXYD2_FULL_41_8]